MIDDAHRTEDVVTEHLPQFFIGIGAMGTGGDEHDHIVEADGPLELLEDGGDNGAPGWGRVPSQTAMATVCPGRTSWRRGGPLTGRRRAATTSARPSAAGGG